MIEPTDTASDEGWDEQDPTEDTEGETIATASKVTTNSDQTDDDDDDDNDDNDDNEVEDATNVSDDDNGEETDGNGAPARKRRRYKKRSEPVTAADERAQQALDFVTKVVVETEMDCRVRLRRPKNEEDVDEVNIEIYGKDAGRIIGKKGSVLQAIQFLTHRVINRPGLDRRHVLVDAEGYRSRRDNSLATMARRLGKQAVDQGKIITFEPMNPRDRRVVHLALAKFEGVITKSDGEGDDRRVQIIPVRR
jgi:spoIIIJ-associated protein